MSSLLDKVVNRPYEAGFVTEIEAEVLPKGLNEDVIRTISQKKGEPDWLLAFRLEAYRRWLDEVDPELLRAPSTAWASRWRSRSAWPAWPWTRSSTRSRSPPPSSAKLAEVGVIFCSFSEAVREHPELVQVPGLGGPLPDNFYAALNSRGLLRRLLRLHPQGRALPDGAVHLLPHQRGEHRPVRAHPDRRRRGRHVSYLEGCTAPMRDENQLHAAVVELVALEDAVDQVLHRAELVPRRQGRQGRHLQLRHQARQVRGTDSKISWTQVETGSAITWKYPSCILRATTRWASSTRWPSPTTTSRPTPAPR
jgi:Fe-S cluster assembly protein SufB